MVLVITSVSCGACGGAARPVAVGADERPTAAPMTAPSTVSPRPRPGASGHPAGGVAHTSGRNVNDGPSVGDPTFLTIASIGVRSELLPLGLAPDGTAQVPGDPQRAGWFTGGPRPGDDGPAVIVGHIDSLTGPAVFFRLRELHAGDQVVVGTTSGRLVAFSVDRVEQVAKNAFPTAEVYGPAQGRQLRLITCGGSFDRSTGHYRDNVIVFLTMIPGRAKP